MPVQNTSKADESGLYFHISNKGIENRNLFNDEQDYEVFLGYLKDYLTAPPDPKKIKKSFSINGRVFRGVPHQPKNYLKKVELIAYSLLPDRFHLLLRQITKGSLGKFIRSLSTRYAIYYNKKYQRTGSLFAGPYKSVQIKKLTPLLYLTRHLYRSSKENSPDLTDSYSSYAEYLGMRKTSWVKPKVVLSFFDKSKNETYKGIDGYRNFVEKYELDQKEKQLLKGIILEKEPKRFKRKAPLPTREEPTKAVPSGSELSPRSRFFGLIAATAVFWVLFYLGLNNVRAVVANSQIPLLSPIPSVLKAEDEKPEEVKTKTMLVVKTGDGSVRANIRQEPTIHSEIIGKAKDGDLFEFVSLDSDWYEVELPDESTGFISAAYIEKIESIKN